MQIKTTLRYNLTLVRMLNINKTSNNCWRTCGGKGTVIRCWLKCKLVQPLWKTVWRLPPKLRLELSYDPATPLLGIYLKNLKTFICKDIYTPMFIEALFTVAKPWKQLKGPLMEDWIKKMRCTYTMEHYSAIRWNTVICNNMVEPWGYHAKWKKSHRKS